MRRAESDQFPLAGTRHRPRTGRDAPIRDVPIGDMANVRRDVPRYRILLLAELDDFVALRRNIGVARARLVIEAVLVRLAIALPMVRAMSSAQTTL